MNPRRDRLLLLTVVSLLIGVAFRVWYVVFEHPPKKFLYSDMEVYASLAKRMLDPEYTPWAGDTIYPPGMAVWLAGLYTLDPGWDLAAWAHALLSCLLPPLMGLLAAELYGRRVALLTVTMASLYFPFVELFAFFLSEGPFLVLQALCLWLWLVALRARSPVRSGALAFVGGVAFGAATVIRTVFLATGGLAALALGVVGWRARWRRAALVLGLALVGASAPLVPAAVRCTTLNEGRFCPISINGPVNFLQGHYGDVGWFYFKDKETGHVFHVASPTALQVGRESKKTFHYGIWNSDRIMATAWKWIREHPIDAALNSITHVSYLYVGSVPWPSSHTAGKRWTVLYEQLHLILLLLPALFYLRERWRPLVRLERDAVADLLAVTPAISLWIVVGLTLGEPRYRQAIDGFTMMLAARFYLRERGPPAFPPPEAAPPETAGPT